MYRAFTADNLHVLGWKRLEDAMIDAYVLSVNYPSLVVWVEHRDGTRVVTYVNGIQI